jgi:multidrug efflux pump subunit AcrA (membrane-fusion protein)
MTKRTVMLSVVSALAAVTLAACGMPSASHVVKGTVPPVATTSTTAPSTTPTTTAVATTPPSDALSSQTLDQVGAELGSLDTSLNTADADLNNPQGDS